MVMKQWIWKAKTFRIWEYGYSPSPSLSNKLKASLNSEIWSSVSWSAIVVWCDRIGLDFLFLWMGCEERETERQTRWSWTNERTNKEQKRFRMLRENLSPSYNVLAINTDPTLFLISFTIIRIPILLFLLSTPQIIFHQTVFKTKL